MNRWGYLLVVVVLVALAVYAFSPVSDGNDTVKLWTAGDSVPGEFRVLEPGMDQEVRGELMKLDGHFRKTDPERVQQFWGMLQQVTVPTKSVISAVPESQLTAYGIDGHHGLEAMGKMLRWGQSGGNGYVWDGARILSVPLPALAAVMQSAQRLDDHKLLVGCDTVSRVRCDGLLLEQVNGAWQDTQRPQRPGLQNRMSRLVALLNGLELRQLTPSAHPDTVVLSMDLWIGHPQSQHHVEIAGGAHGQLVTIDDLPAQPITQEAVHAWTTVIHDLHRDWMLDYDGAMAVSRVTALVVSTGNLRSFDAHRVEGAYRVGDTHWELTWDGGAENASEAAVDQVFSRLCAVAVDHADPGTYPAPSTPFAKAFAMSLQGGGMLVLHIDGLNVWTQDFHGRLSQPDPLVDLQVADLLQLTLIAADPQRIVKLQRQSTHPPLLSEVVTRSESGLWSRTYPTAASVDPVGIGRVVRALCGATALSARLDTDEDRQALVNPPLTIDLRLAPLAEGAPRMEIANERDTVSQNRGFCFYRDGQKRWRAVDVEGGVSYQIDEDLVSVVSEPFQADALFPLVPALVKRIEVTTSSGAFALFRSGDGWSLQGLEPGATAQAADALEVRRFLRQLSELTASEHHPDRDAVLPGQASLVISCDMPAREGDERLVLTMAAPEGSGAEVSVTSTLSGSGLPPGRQRVPLAAAEELLVKRQRFLPMQPR